MPSKIKVIIAANAFKECLDAYQVAYAIEQGINSDTVETSSYIMADGGDGLLKSIETIYNDYELIDCQVIEPRQNKTIIAQYIIHHQTAIIEMGLASGLALVPPKYRHALKATSYATGQLIIDAIEKGCRKLIIGLGGSSCTDGGTGLAQALGYRFYNKNNQLLPNHSSPLINFISMDNKLVHPLLNQCQFIIASDVTNPLLGEKGSAKIFAKQKGASEQTIQLLEQKLSYWAKFSQQYLKKNDDICHFSGAGAAGGLGFFLHNYLDAKILSGSEWIINQSNIEQEIINSQLIITTEGSLENQSCDGKITQIICQLGKKHQVPVIIIAGALIEGWQKLHQQGLTAGFSLAPYPTSFEKSIQNAQIWLTERSQQILNTFLAGRKS